MATRDELLGALVARYREARRPGKGRILTEFAAVTGYHRKHAERLLRGAHRKRAVAPSPRAPSVRPGGTGSADRALGGVGPDLRQAAEAADPDADRGDGAAWPSGAGRGGAGAAGGDQRRDDRSGSGTDAASRVSGRRRRTASSPAIRRSVPIRTYADWNDPPPGFVEADLVAHSGPSTSGSFVQTLVLTDIASGWTECAPLLFREQQLLSEVMTVMREVMPFPLLGFDTDNDTVFINETIKSWCETAGVEFTRSRPYRKNDQAHIEQKNGAIVRRMVGYRRFEGLAAAEALARLYRPMRLFVNFFQPSFRLAEKHREGALVRKRYHPPLTPHQRLVADARVPQELKDALNARHCELDPVRLLSEICATQQALVEIADMGRRGRCDRRPAPRRHSTRSSPVCVSPGRKVRCGRRRGESRPSRAAGRARSAEWRCRRARGLVRSRSKRYRSTTPR